MDKRTEAKKIKLLKAENNVQQPVGFLYTDPSEHSHFDCPKSTYG